MTSPTVARFLERLDGVRSDGTGWSARCPCRQDDQNPSLHVGEGDDGRVLVTCHRGGGCNLDQIIDAMGLKKTDLFPNTTTGPDREIVDTYKYTDEHGKFAYAKVRYRNPDGTKAFSQYRILNGEKIHSLGDTPRYLYRLPRILDAIANNTVIWLVEGEKDVHTLEHLGKVATTMTDGAGKWRPEYTTQLTGAKIALIADNDDAGLDHAYLVARRLRANGSKVKILTPPHPHNDVTDLIQAGHPLTDLTQLDPAPPPPPAEPHHVPEPTNGVRYGTPTLQTRNWSAWLDEHHDDSYDWIIPGLLERTDRVLVVAAEGAGKMLDLNEPILTTTGWTTIGELKVGDQVFDRFGKPCNVTALSPIDPNPDSRWITFSTGERIRACVDHQWLTVDYRHRQPNRRPSPDCRHWHHDVHTTADIETTLHARGGHTKNHAIAAAGPLQFPLADLPIDPYTLGVWLGDGSSRTNNVTLNADDAPHIINRIPYPVGLDREPRPTCRLSTIHGISPALRTAGLYQNKHIPDAYLHASVEQRLALLQGICDTDGYCPDGSGHGRGTGSNLVEITFTNERLATDTAALVRSLGILANVTTAPAHYTRDGVRHDVGTRWRITFQTDLPVFTVPRKAARLQPLRTQRAKLRYITAVEPADPVPMRCIQVDSPDHSYLVGTGLIPTHNSMLARQIAICAAVGLHPFTREPIPPIRTLSIDLENPDRIIRRKSRDIMNVAKKMARYTGHPPADIIVKPDGIDLLDPAWRTELEAAITAADPDLICIGPIYKAYVDSGKNHVNNTIIELVRYLDHIRTTHHCALWIEHHAPLSDGGTRTLRPIDSSVWQRWPEFGLALDPDIDATTPHTYKLRHFRGARDERHWPHKLTRGRTLPFDEAP